MSAHTINHASFVIERNYKVSVSKAFAAFSNPTTKKKWFAEGEGFTIDEFKLDFRVGGTETSKFRFTGDGSEKNPTSMSNDTVFMDIIENERIVFAYTMTIGDKRISSSLASVEFKEANGGTQLIFTEQGAFFDGADTVESRKGGWNELLASLEKELTK